MIRKVPLVAALLILGCSGAALGVETELWDIFELTLQGPSDGNPFVDVTLKAEFSQGCESFEPAVSLPASR